MATELDTEQQARLSFLEEAETYFKDIETVILDLNQSDQRLQQLDQAMRAAHSVKGAAGMMGFLSLSQVAHKMEDCFKILRARNLQLEPEVETLLLQGLDCLRDVRQHHYDQTPIDNSWLEIHITLIFDKLRDHLGELTEADEDQLLADEEGVDPKILAFTAAVEPRLETLEQRLPTLQGKELLRAIAIEAKQLLQLGRTAEIEPFIALCVSVLQQCRGISAVKLPTLTTQSLQAWQRSLSLIQLGRLDQLPRAIALTSATASTSPPPTTPPPTTSPPTTSPPTTSPPTTSPPTNTQLAASPPSAAPQSGHQNTQQETNSGQQHRPTASNATAPNATAPQQRIQAAQPSRSTAAPPTPISGTIPAKSSFQNTSQGATQRPAHNPSQAPPHRPPHRPTQHPTQPTIPVATTRVPVTNLQAINQLIGSLLLDRNAIQLRLEQLQTFAGLLRERVNAIEEFNVQVRQWYDQTSGEEMGGRNKRGATVANVANNGAHGAHGANNEAMVGYQQQNGFANSTSSMPRAEPSIDPIASHKTGDVEMLLAEFDALEMDQYSDLHLLARDQMETIVKLQEVAADVDLGLQELGQSVEQLNYTGQVLQKQINLAQMRPFEDIVGRFPRLIRDLATTHGKQVKLQISGQGILFERYALEMLTDPLMHLIRNAFDHGIEDPMTRQTQGKPLEGLIQLRASNRGSRAVITIQDDGCGINLAKVRDRAHSYGIPADQIQGMNRQQLLNLIFKPGFTTTEQLTELSGRGVGMDVVQANVTAINGTIHIDTEWSKGTTFTISIPLSLSLLRVVLLEQNNIVFALPAGDVREMVPLNPEHIINSDGKEAIVWRETAIPLIRMAQYWSMRNNTVRPISLSGNPLIDRSLVVILGTANQEYGMVIDRFWQEEEVAVRPIASPIPLPPGFSGTTLSGDGRVIPLADPTQLWNWMTAKTARISQTPTATTPIPSGTDTPKILVVDDSIHVRRYLVLTLTRAGYTTEQAKDGHEALDLLNSGLLIQAVICDVEMPRMDGYGVLDAVRKQSQFADLPIIMLTSRSSNKHRKLAMNLGASAYFSKPYNEQQLLQSLIEFGVTP